MKKIIPILVVLVLVLAVVGVAQAGPSWGSGFPFTAEPVEPENLAPPLALESLGDPSQQFKSIGITESGLYYMGGICSLNIEYKKPNVRNDADTEVPVDFSRTIPYNPPNDKGYLYLPGCHLVHFKEDKKVDTANAEDGTWEVCFGEQPGYPLRVYYYLDSSSSKVWIPLPTRHDAQAGLACASAPYTGEYAPAYEPQVYTGGGPGGGQVTPGGKGSGTVQPPPPSVTVGGSGNYTVGGLCSLIVEYIAPELSDKVHIQDPYLEDPVDWDAYVPFPDSGWLLNQPGCHVLHYEKGEIVRWVMDETKGKWKICFAAVPNHENKIYYYLGDLTDFASDWQPLESTVENGKVCAPAQHTGMYTPASNK